MTRILLISILILLNVACAQSEDPFACGSDPESGDVLVIGDSISVGYMPTIAAEFPGLKVVHNPCNAHNSRNTAVKIDTWLAVQDQFEAITFNNGLWDIAVFTRISEGEYEINLRSIARKVKAKTSRPLFILTTPVPLNTPYRLDQDVQAYNTIALRVMQDEGIQVLDLYSFVRANPSMELPGDVHYTDAGSRALGFEVSTRLRSMGL